MGVAFYLVYRNTDLMRNRINEDFNQQQLILARQAASQIDAILSDFEMELASLAANPEVDFNRRAFFDAIKTMTERTRNKGIIEAGFISTDGKSDTVFKIGELEANVDRETVKKSQPKTPGEIVLSDAIIESIRKDTVVTAVLGVRALDGGSLYVRLNLSELVASVTRNIRSGKTGYAWVIDEVGMFIYHPDKSFIGKNAFTARYQRKPYISFAQINSIMRDLMLKGEEGSGMYESGWHRGVEGRITKLIAFSPLKSKLITGNRVWSVAVTAPISEVAEAVHQVYISHLAIEMAMIAGMFIFVLLVIIYQQKISRALKAKVSRQEELIASILKNSVDAIMFIDNENRIKVWNRGAELIFGYKAEEMIDQTFHRLVPPDIDADEELKHIQEEVNKNGYIRNYRAPRVTKDGRRITIDLSRTAIYSDDGEIIGSTAIIKDVTDKMELEQKIYNTEKLASIGILAAGVAHEINNPLAIILGFTDLLLEKHPRGSPEYEDLKMIEENANHAKKVVENMLGFARITEGLEEIVDIRHSLNTVMGIAKNTLMTKKINYRLDIPSELPRVRGDAREFQQVIFNLINNAIGAMEKTGGDLIVSAEEKDGQVIVRVRDNGSGIPEKIKPRIFDPFFTTKKVGEGTGLGLSLCYGIVKKYGGKIDFVSSSKEDYPDKPSGTTFIVSMPIIEDEQ
jgi:PAS domain S-box-containing protein